MARLEEPVRDDPRYAYSTFAQVSLAALLALVTIAVLPAPHALAQQNQEEVTNQDEVNPALVRPFWLGAALAPQPAAPPYVLTAGERTRFQGTFGIDLSHYTVDRDPNNQKCKTQEGYADPACSCSVDWQTVSDNQILYVYTKASDGSGVDLSFSQLWAQLGPQHTNKKIYRGAYHFLRPGVDADTQAATFLKAIGATNGTKPAQLSPVVDIEWSTKRILPGTDAFNACPVARRTEDDNGNYYCDMWYQLSAGEIGVLAAKWIADVESATGQPVTIYTNPTGWWNKVMTSSQDALLNGRAVWTSRYTSAGPQYDPRWTAQNGSPTWKMAPLPRGASYPTGTTYSIPNFWQFSEAALLPTNLLICAGRSTRKSVDMNWIPVTSDQYRTFVHSSN